MNAIRKYRKKPVIIEALQWTGTNQTELFDFCGPRSDLRFLHGCVNIPTLEGIMTANPGDYIIKGVAGEFYPCKPDIFEETYEEVSEQE